MSNPVGDTSSESLCETRQDQDIDPRILETLTWKYYMKAHEPWDVYDFPQQYIPRVKYDYFPPTFVLGAAVTLSEYMGYANQKQPLSSSSPDSDNNQTQSPLGTVSNVPKHETHGHPPIQMVWTRSDIPYILPICSNYSLEKRFPEEECEELLDALESAGIKANVDWYLSEDYSQWEEEELLDWSQQYQDMVAKRKRSKSHRQ
ncbi:hypothetical protein K435DRAFT_970564 [Dendrothele bispora CBS 962.96]|uniref:Uncharacterized protein n=1 Tax=Dendrothele bispora (strain CBS 962.96) TaxID=1314807 RepID=A0A4S8LAU2_DENBC|nr:hypothetical protein K435DRAFT_970564 [Dendrothele bispora CBS 962.96]